MAGQTGIGALSTVGYAIETTVGTYVAPNKWLFPESNTLQKDFDIITKKVMSGTRYSTRVARTTLTKPTGQLGYPLFATHGAPIIKAAMGSDTYQTALTPDTVKAATPVTTVNGVSTVTVTNTGAVTYVLGGLITVGAGLTSECRPILSITGNTAAGTILTVPALQKQATAAAGTVVKQIGQHKFGTAPTAAALPTLSLESNEAQLYSYKYAGCYVNKWNLKASKDNIAVATDLMTTAKPIYLASPTTPAPSAAELSDMLRPLTIADGLVAGYGDVTATGTATYGGTPAAVSAAGIQHLIGVEDFEFDWNNGVLLKPAWNLSSAYRAFPGEQDATIKFKYINEAKRDAEWDDYIAQFQTNVVPWILYAGINTSTTGTEAWVGMSLYVPAASYVKATPIRVMGDTIGQQIEMHVLPQTATGDALQIFLSNADVAGY